MQFKFFKNYIFLHLFKRTFLVPLFKNCLVPLFKKNYLIAPV